MDRIILIAQQIAKEGKVPNTALIKSRLPKNVPLPAIIQGLKLWRENPDKEINSPSEPALTAAADSEGAASFDALLEIKIEQMIKPLFTEIADLKEQLETLQKQLNTEDKE
ncbi:hypothetical protein [Psychromonas ossibalaenae]|uniref:hypothetical protein n=1 Tax=Psychromonas ossibalaenae TaxID=444922 RepID=UPI000367911E|nr:hypothetical protein [Psychromonas ossibalaenae]